MSNFGLTIRDVFATIVVILGIAFLMRLGLWQLDRHEKRQAFNSRVESQQILPPLLLDQTAPLNFLENMEYRAVSVTGEYNFDDQVALINQAWENSPGVNLITPLVIEGLEQSVLVNRGWIPLEDAGPANWDQYDEAGPVFVDGIIRQSDINPEIGNKSDPLPVPGTGGLKEWNLLNVERIDSQVQGDLLPIYIHKSAIENASTPPIPTGKAIEVSDGPHLGYAGQWFLFALLLAVGYPIYFYRSRIRQEPNLMSLVSEGDHS